MESVSVATLKSKLSHCLRAVRKGKEIEITSHQHPVARLVPANRQPAKLEIIPATQPSASLKKLKGINLKCDPLSYLLEDRRHR